MSQLYSKQFGRFLLLLLLYCPAQLPAQCVEKNAAFTAGEVIEYQVAYNWKFVWLNAGQVTFAVQDTTINQKPAYLLQGVGGSYKFYDWIYTVRDTYQVVVDTLNLKPYQFRRNVTEGKYTAQDSYYFNHEAQQVVLQTQSSLRPYAQDTLQLKDCAYDVLTMIYIARNLDYSIYKKNDKIPISVIIDNEAYDLYVRFLGEEPVKTRKGKVYDCYKFKPQLVEGTIFQGGENMTVWVSKDSNHIPILVEAKILVGSVKAYLTKVTNPKHGNLAEREKKKIKTKTP